MIEHERGSQALKPPPPASPAAPPLSASRRRFSRVGRKHSNGSVQSSSSSGTARSTESVGIRQPAKNRIRRQQQRLSVVFGRGARAEPAGMSGEEAAVTDDPSELSNHITAPGILKIFGTEICQGANYKSVLATTHSSAGELVKEALARYSLSKAEAEDYVLCDVIGRIEEQSWRTECVRVVGDNEKPLLLQSLWKPREGFARRFEIQRKATVEEHNSREKDTVTAGLNAQARKLQKTRSRGKSVPLDICTSEDAVDERLSLFKSLSETNLSAEAQSARTDGPPHDRDRAPPEAYKDAQGPGSEREETESSDDNCTQYSIHPPLHFPYFLLLRGFSFRQDFVLYTLISGCTVFGCHSDQTDTERDADRVRLWAPDLLPRHCCVRRPDTGAGRPATATLLRPLDGAKVKRNGAVVSHEEELQSGDVIALGDHYLFMYKDPTSPSASVSGRTPGRPTLCQTCVLSERARAPRAFRDLQGSQLVLVYEAEQESRVLQEIFSAVEQDKGAHKLTAAFLLCLCVQRSVTHFSMPDLRRLLLQTANQIQTIVWEKAKELAALQPQMSESELIRALEPLLLWMSNSVQILHFIQQELPRLLRGVSEDEEEEEEDCTAVLELRLTSVRSASEEAMTVLEEVLMFSFQQCVYYLTKILYAVLPGVLDSNAFSESGQLQVSDEVRRVLDVCMKTLQMLREFHVHPEIRSQLFSYLFFFINALLFNLLMERGSGGGFYHWSRGVQIRANLDLLMDWTHGAGFADLAQSFLLKLSSAVNLLATPKENLLQMSWKALRMEFTSLNAAQLHHILREYNPRRSCPAAWTPCRDEASAALTTTDILESFDNHPPLILPVDGFMLELKRPVIDSDLIEQLHRFQRLIEQITDPESDPQPSETPESVSAVPMEAKLTKVEVHPKAHLEVSHTEMVFPHAGPSDLGSSEALLTRKLQNLELQNKVVERPALDPSCLLTPPNTPLNMELTDSETDSHISSSRREEEGEGEECAVGDEDVFVLQLQRAACGLGLLLVDGEEAPCAVGGIFIKSVLPDSPAALSERLRAGDRILAVNGLSLVGVDYQTALDLIQTSGDRPRLLLSRSHCPTRETRTNASA